jgi:hypothetical protein
MEEPKATSKRKIRKRDEYLEYLEYLRRILREDVMAQPGSAGEIRRRLTWGTDDLLRKVLDRMEKWQEAVRGGDREQIRRMNKELRPDRFFRTLPHLYPPMLGIHFDYLKVVWGVPLFGKFEPKLRPPVDITCRK